MTTQNQYGQPVGEPLPDWQPRSRPQRVTLSGRYCLLEPLTQAHAPALFAAHSQAEDARHWTWLPREQDGTAKEYGEWIASTEAHSDPLHFAVIDIKSGQPVGSLALMRIEPSDGVMEVGHVHFSPLLSRKPMATEAQWLLMRYAFETLGYRRYEWKCDSLNAPSRRAALRLGFQFEGCFRQARVVKGRNRDTDWFSIIDSEWPAVDRALRNWLAIDNFHDDGSQKRTLESWRQTPEQ